MSKLVKNNPAILEAHKEFRRFKSNPDMQDLERQRRRDHEDM